MRDKRDPELDWMRAQWQPPRMRRAADEAVFAAYRGRFAMRRRARRFWFPLAAAALAAMAAVALVAVRPAPLEYRPVAQPRIVVLSQGERP